MDTNISKAQLEVWQWKQKVYEEMKHLSTREQMQFIHEQTKELVERIKKKKKLKRNSEN